MIIFGAELIKSMCEDRVQVYLFLQRFEVSLGQHRITHVESLFPAVKKLSLVGREALHFVPCRGKLLHFVFLKLLLFFELLSSQVF